MIKTLTAKTAVSFLAIPRLAAYTDSGTGHDRLTCCTPNPTNGAVTIGYALMPETTRAMVIVTNLEGTTVASVECDISETSVDMNITGAVPGVYLATLVCTPSNISVCVTKQGYIPRLMNITNHVVYIQDETVAGPKRIDADTVRIGSHVTDSRPSGTAVIGTGEVFIEAGHIIIEDGTVINDKANLIINNKGTKE